jgi:hypothetical protein
MKFKRKKMGVSSNICVFLSTIIKDIENIVTLLLNMPWYFLFFL